MKKHLVASILFPICAIAHNLLFWGEKMGLNTLLFALIMIAALFFLHPESRNSRPALISAAGVILTAVMIVWHNSLMAKATHILFFIALTGFVQSRELKFIFYAFSLGIVSLLDMRVKIFQEVFTLGGQRSPGWRLASNSRMMVVVAPVFALFFGLYFAANQKFAEISSEFFTNIWTYLLETFSLSRLLSLALSVIVAGSILWKTSSAFFEKLEAKQGFRIVRQRIDSTKNSFANTLGLKKEFQTAVLLVASLNLLLLIVNIVDIRYVWFGDAPGNPLTLKQYVHEGTYVLILAILLAMAVLLIFFRRNLNFYPGNQAIKWAAYAWIVQNAILACSVGVRNVQYIESCGLAYKRIGVFVFLLLTLFGLWTMYLKISRKRSLYFLLFQNGWALFTALLLVSFVNWDVFISRYNIAANTTFPLDTEFLIDGISDKNLYLLSQHTAEIGRKSGAPGLDRQIERKWERFSEKQKAYSWLSWNWADHQNLRFKGNG